MQHNFATSTNQIPADFTSAHIALLIEIRDKAIATVRKDGAKMSDLNSALNILIKVEKQFYTLTHRRPPGQKTRHSRHEPPQIIPFRPASDQPQPPGSSASPNQNLEMPEKPLSPAPKATSDDRESQCMLKHKGYIYESCGGCIQGVCCLTKA